MYHTLAILPDSFDPYAALDAWSIRGCWPLVYWRTPGGERILACGTAARAESILPCRDWRAELLAHARTLGVMTGADTTGTRAAIRDELLDDRHAALRRGGPPAFFTVPFDPSHNGGDAWRAFARVALHVPRLAIVLDGMRAGVYTCDDAAAPMLAMTAQHQPPAPASGSGADGAIHAPGHERTDADIEGVTAAVAPGPPVPLSDRSPDVSAAFADRASYRDAVQRALAHIGSGGTEKIVIAREERRMMAGSPRLPDLVRTIDALHPASFCIAFALSENEIFISATPERLARVDAHHLATEAVAGTWFDGDDVGATREQGGSEDAAFLTGEKITREHEHVVRMIADALEPICEELHVGGRSVRAHRAVRHLVTPIHAELRAEQGMLDVVTALHPTPAVAGTPRDAAMEAIAGIEGFARGLFAGAIGWIDAAGDGEAAVTIRSALLTDDGALLHAGAGIVAGSDPELEERETRAKLGAMQEVLAQMDRINAKKEAEGNADQFR